LANLLVEFVVNGKKLPSEIENFRLFRRWAKRLKIKEKD
jgi:tRNA 5-methylaminomethyl-2-thiouridine biosynthesis bifunctional protein